MFRSVARRVSAAPVKAIRHRGSGAGSGIRRPDTFRFGD